MKRDRLQTVLHVRDLVEKRRLAEKAAAQREHDTAVAATRAAVAARAALLPVAGSTSDPGGLVVDRLVSLALQDAVVTAKIAEENAERTVAIAERRRTLAAIERRSVERLAERRELEADRAAAKVDERRLDEAGLTGWRRRRA